jgi:hypothetical protein
MLPSLEPPHLARCATADALRAVTAPVERRVCVMHVRTWAGSVGFFGRAGPAQKALGRNRPATVHLFSIFEFLYLFLEIRSRFKN